MRVVMINWRLASGSLQKKEAGCTLSLLHRNCGGVRCGTERKFCTRLACDIASWFLTIAVSDISFICLSLDLKPGDVVLESGYLPLCLTK